MDEPLQLDIVCPNCRSKNVAIMDHGLKRLYRLLIGNNRYYCRTCHSTWRRKFPNSTLSVRKSKNHHVFPVVSEGEWKIILLPNAAWHQIIREMHNTVDFLLSKGFRKIVMDISNLKFFNTFCVGEIIKIHKRCSENSGQLKLRSPSADAKELLFLTNLGFLLEEKTSN